MPLTRATISQSATLGSRFTLNQSTVNGSLVNSVAVTIPTPEYWWRADSGLTTSTWTAYNGGIDFTLTNVTSADSVNGIYFNGTNGQGLTGNLAADIDAKHIFIRFDSLTKPVGTLVALIGGTINNVHQAPAYFNSGGFFWYYVPYETTSTLAYAARSTTDVATTAIWADFANNGSSVIQYANTQTTGATLTTYAGTFNNRFRWASNYGIYLGRRQQGNYAQFYLKEFAIFTTALTQEQGLLFRDDMLSRWP